MELGVLDKLFRTTNNARARRPRWELLTKAVIVNANRPQDGPMITRWRILQTPWGGIYVHQLHRPDADRDLHDHPWTFWSLVLRGGYIEHRNDCPPNPLGSRPIDRGLGSLHRMPLISSHRITVVSPGTVTLVLVGPKRKDWGFWVTQRYMDSAFDGMLNRFVPWREYTGIEPASADPFGDMS